MKFRFCEKQMSEESSSNEATSLCAKDRGKARAFVSAMCPWALQKIRGCLKVKEDRGQPKSLAYVCLRGTGRESRL